MASSSSHHRRGDEFCRAAMLAATFLTAYTRPSWNFGPTMHQNGCLKQWKVRSAGSSWIAFVATVALVCCLKQICPLGLGAEL